MVTWSPFVSSVSCDYPENDPQWPDLKSKATLRFRFVIPNRHGRHWDVKVTLPRPSEWRARSCWITKSQPKNSRDCQFQSRISREKVAGCQPDSRSTGKVWSNLADLAILYAGMIFQHFWNLLTWIYRSFWTIPTTDLYYPILLYWHIPTIPWNSNFWGLETTLPLGMAMFFFRSAFGGRCPIHLNGAAIGTEQFDHRVLCASVGLGYGQWPGEVRLWRL